MCSCTYLDACIFSIKPSQLIMITSWLYMLLFLFLCIHTVHKWMSYLFLYTSFKTLMMAPLIQLKQDKILVIFVLTIDNYILQAYRLKEGQNISGDIFSRNIWLQPQPASSWHHAAYIYNVLVQTKNWLNLSIHHLYSIVKHLIM